MTTDQLTPTETRYLTELLKMAREHAHYSEERLAELEANTTAALVALHDVDQ